MASELSPEAVCDFIRQHGGKVKNSILVPHFKQFFSDPQTRDNARQRFKECVNAVAMVKTENNEKYVHLKKKYRTSSSSASTAASQSSKHPASNSPSTESLHSTFKPAPKATDAKPPQKVSSAETVATESNAHHEAGTNKNESSKSVEDKASAMVFKGEVASGMPIVQPSPTKLPKQKDSKSSAPSAKPHDEAASGKTRGHTPEGSARSSPQPSHRVAATNKGGHHSISSSPDLSRRNTPEPPRRGSAAVNSSPGTPETPRNNTSAEREERRSNGTPRPGGGGDFAVPSVPIRRRERKENMTPNMNDHRQSAHIGRIKSSLLSSPHESLRPRNRPITIYQTQPSLDRSRPNLAKNKAIEDIADNKSLSISNVSIDSKVSAENDGEDEYERVNAAPVSLDPHEKEWMLLSSRGDLVEMRRLLDIDPSLVERKDFFMGYTALHRAARKGNRDMAQMLIEMNCSLNTQSNGGYTPLHLAAINGHEEIVTLLLESNADPNIRDYSGRHPVQYLKKSSKPLQSKNSNPSNDSSMVNVTSSWRFHTFGDHRYVRARTPQMYSMLKARMRPDADKTAEEVFRRTFSFRKTSMDHHLHRGSVASLSAMSESDEGEEIESRHQHHNPSSKTHHKLSRAESVLRGFGLKRRNSHKKSRVRKDQDRYLHANDYSSPGNNDLRHSTSLDDIQDTRR